MAGKKARDTKLSTILLVTLLIGGILVSYASSVLISNFVIQSSGSIGNDVYAASGSPSAIQAAVNSLPSSGGTVHIPSGTFHWNGEKVTIPGGVNVVGASFAGCMSHENNWAIYNASTILHNDKTGSFADMFFVDGSNGKKTRISGIQFEGTVVGDDNLEGTGIRLSHVINARVDHCTFINFPNTAVEVSNTNDGTAYAVIDHCVIDNPYKLTYGGSWGYGFYVIGKYPNWDSNIQHFLGQWPAPSSYPMMYVEDCKISRTRHAVDAIQSGWVVARYNYIDHPYPTNYGQLEIHGSGGGSWTGGRGYEFYNNTVVCEASNRGEPSWLRGGGGAVFNNTFRYVGDNGAIQLFNEDGIAGTTVHNLWIWNNVADNTVFRDTTGAYVQNSDYFLRAPTQALDGFTYTTYQYPHPLTLTG